MRNDPYVIGLETQIEKQAQVINEYRKLLAEKNEIIENQNRMLDILESRSLFKPTRNEKRMFAGLVIFTILYLISGY